MYFQKYSGIHNMQRFRMNEILKANHIDPAKASKQQLQDAALQAITDANAAVSYYRFRETVTTEHLQAGPSGKSEKPVEPGSDFTISIPEAERRTVPPGMSEVIDMVALFRARYKRSPSREEFFAIALDVGMRHRTGGREFGMAVEVYKLMRTGMPYEEAKARIMSGKGRP